MRSFIRYLLQLGALGLVAMGILDSSFLFLPTGNDLLLIVLTVRHNQNVVVYVIAAAFGSMLGVLLLDVVSRKLGEEGLKKVVSPKTLSYVKGKVKSRAAIMLVLAALAPPPFPFTVIIATASAFQYPRLRLLGVILGSRLVRFAMVGYVAIRFGRPIIEFMRSEEFRWVIGIFAAICVAGSVMSVMKWVRAAKSARPRGVRSAT
jgi:membrane protein YqaA with SNARE-associated domain